jgi:dCTP deaminase
MIWGNKRIVEWAKDNVDPFTESLVNPASIDLRLGKQYRIPLTTGWSESFDGFDDGIKLVQGGIYLLHTLEITTLPDNASGILYLKSKSMRRGIEILHGGYGDPGFSGQWTMTVVNHWPYEITIYPGDPIVQLVLFDVSGIDLSYRQTGHYQGSVGPTG